jgi:site-specific DNA-methyltransferase (adenine-specific)
LITDIINKHSNPGDLVLDNFAGTGTTAHACILTDRKYIVMERDEKYFEIIKSRINGLSEPIK